MTPGEADSKLPVQRPVVLDCRQCGVCCRGRPGTVLVDAEDLLLWKREGRDDLATTLVPGHFSLPALPADPAGRCCYQGTPTSERDCSIYAVRPRVCRDFAVGSSECLTARSLGRRD